jgi:hypothetical protein
MGSPFLPFSPNLPVGVLDLFVFASASASASSSVVPSSALSESSPFPDHSSSLA